MRIKSWIYGVLSLGLVASVSADDSLMLAGYDVIRDYYQRYLPVFTQQYQQQQQRQLTVAQSFTSASKQAIAVQNGLPADVVTLNQQNDIDGLVVKGLVAKNWRQAYPNQAQPFHTVVVFLVREGNPKHIHDWQDLARDDVKVVFANPKTSGSGRYVYLSALGYAYRKWQDPNKIEHFIATFLKNVPVFDSGARAASITFSQRDIGDVLITAENEAALLAQAQQQKSHFSLVYPSISATIPVVVAEVQKNTTRHQNQALAQQFLHSLWLPQAQQIAAESYLRPNNPDIFLQYQARFPKIDTFDLNQHFGDWQQINQRYFADGGQFDRLYLK